MNYEELFCKLFPEYVVNRKPLSPYFDLFESGYEQAENHYEGIEKENAELKLKLEALEGQTPWKDIKDKSEVIGKLTKAKEIITKIMQRIPSFQAKSFQDLSLLNALSEAEQFLNSEVGK